MYDLRGELMADGLLAGWRPLVLIPRYEGVGRGVCTAQV